MDKRLNLTYSLDNNLKFLLEQYNQVDDFFRCTHRFEPFKPNFKDKCDKCYKFHILRHRVTCTICELSICRRCSQELFNFTFDRKDKLQVTIGCNPNTDKEVISQLLKRIRTLEDQIEELKLANERLKSKEEYK